MIAREIRSRRGVHDAVLAAFRPAVVLVGGLVLAVVNGPFVLAAIFLDILKQADGGAFEVERE